MTVAPRWPAEVPPPVSFEAIGGGWVGDTRRATLADGRVVVVKQSPFPAAVEADGLAALARAGVPTPGVLAVSGTLLLLEYVQGRPDWAELGQVIARMHRFSGDRYGWHQDNRAGRFVQPNAWSEHWPSFFADHRVRTHLADPEVPDEFRRRLERACDGPIQELLPDTPVPSLTHGDLWRGNTVDGRWVIDPEVSFADRELDLAYMLGPSSNPLPPEFWESYEAEWPIADDFEGRRLILGLHHRLLHVRHFGARALAALDRDLSTLGW
jgi:fructosamine-3-kinase